MGGKWKEFLLFAAALMFWVVLNKIFLDLSFATFPFFQSAFELGPLGLIFLALDSKEFYSVFFYEFFII